MGYEKCRVFMMPTNKKSEIALVTHAGQDYKSLLLYDNEDMSLTKDKTTVMHHLYVASDETTKEGDWVIYNNNIHKCTHKSFNMIKIDDKDWVNLNHSECHKIIATTDKSLELPLIPFDFIELYAEKYNSNNQIINLLVEYIYEETEELSYCFVNHPVVDEDNQIKIKLIKDSWNKEELDVIITKALDDALKHGKSIGTYLVSGLPERYAPLTEESFKNEWIEKKYKFL